MSSELTVTQKRAMKKAELMRKFGQYWYVYLALSGTAILSTVSGLLLPFQPNEQGVLVISVGGILAALYYAIGFLTTGEGAAYFWFDKLTDHDPDSNLQQGIAVLMLVAAIGTSLTTALAASSLIAFWLGVFDTFFVLPDWAQEWVVYAIPTMWVLHFIAGTIFRATSEESEYERQAKSIIRTAKNQMVQAKETARANWWKDHAPELARQMGEAEAQEELDTYKAKIQESKNRRSTGQTQSPTVDSQNRHNESRTDFRPAPKPVPQNGGGTQITPFRSYELDEFLNRIGMNKNQLATWMQENELMGETETREALKLAGKFPADMSNNNFKKHFYGMFPESERRSNPH